MAKRRGYRTIHVPIKGSSVAVYTSPRVADALREITQDMSLYKGVRLMQVMEAVYLQGTKDGAATAFAELDRAVVAAHKAIPHKRPGRPRRRP